MAMADKDVAEPGVAPTDAKKAAKPAKAPRPRISKEHKETWARLDAGGAPKK